MAHQEHQLAGILTEDVNDERRLCECARKFEIIMKQFDELVGIMQNDIAVRKWPKNGRGCVSGRRAKVSSSQPNNNEALVHTVTRFLHELRANPSDSE